jgi:hypothetical protein
MKNEIVKVDFSGSYRMNLTTFADFAKNKKLSPSLDLMRVCVLYFFDRLKLNIDKSSSIAVLGGSRDEPELKLLDVDIENVDVFGISPGEIFLDVNTHLVPKDYQGKYDLVLCSGVVEHIYNHENLIECLSNLTANSGLVFFCFPISNMYHGSPDYFSPGFTTDYFIKFFERKGLLIEDSGSLGGERIYFFTHTLNQWPNIKLYKSPFLFHMVSCLGLSESPRPPIKFLFHRLWARAFAWLIPKSISNENQWQQTGWLLARKAN